MNNHQTVIVRKPWGYEYLAYKNDNLALWVLNIKPGEKTSMHCHPSKTTGLVVVDGIAEINFIADSKVLQYPAKQMIRRGLFHQTCAISKNDVIMFEFETPVDKDDLVRLHDAYGRKDSGYEGTDFELPKTEDCLWIEDPVGHNINHYEIGGSEIDVFNAYDFNILTYLDPEDIIVFLKGGISKTINDRRHLVTIPGDVGHAKVVTQVSKEMDGFDPDTVIMVISERK